MPDVVLTPRGSSSTLGAVVSRLVSLVVFAAIAFALKALLDGFVANEGAGPQRHHASTVEGCVVRLDEMNVTLDDVGGLVRAKEELRYSLLLPMHNPALFYGGRKSLEAPRGFLLVGEPGTGKTMLARAVAKECGACFIAPTLSMLEDKYYGESSKLLQATWDTARRRAPAIIFIDEVDGWLSTRRSDDGSAATGFKTELLRLMDGMQNRRDDAVVVLACTNNAGALDPALRRRLPCIIQVELPGADDRQHILRIAMRDEATPPPEWLAAETAGFSGSDLTHLYRTAASRRLRRVMRTAESSHDGLAGALKVLPSLDDADWRDAIAHARRARDAARVKTCDARTEALRELLDVARRSSAPAVSAADDAASDEVPPPK